MIRTAGTWDPTDRRAIFLAANPQTFDKGGCPATHPYLLTAVNDLGSEAALAGVQALVDAGGSVLIDSGVFWLTNEHKRAHGITMDEALGLHPDEIDGFDWLFDRYCRVIDALGDRCWGYIELDQGGKERKRETRSRLHDLGYRPIPVYHPLNDGPDYFDELAETHDRICFGNIVQADVITRKHLLHFLSEKHRQYPDLWVHVLGMNPSEVFNALPVDSADASTWLAPSRWGRFPHTVMLDPYMELMHYEMRYVMNREPDRIEEVNDELKSFKMAALAIGHTQRCWREWAAVLEEATDLPMYPEPALG